jgi:single-stranded DNA-binding protein
MIDCAFYGFCASDADSRVSQAGKNWVRLRVGTGRDEDVVWLSVAVFGKAAETAAGLRKGDKIYVEGTLRLDSWKGNDGQERHGLSVASFKCERTHQIGRNRPRREHEPHEHNDSPPAADEPPPYDSIPY